MDWLVIGFLAFAGFCMFSIIGGERQRQVDNAKLIAAAEAAYHPAAHGDSAGAAPQQSDAATGDASAKAH